MIELSLDCVDVGEYSTVCVITVEDECKLNNIHLTYRLIYF